MRNLRQRPLRALGFSCLSACLWLSAFAGTAAGQSIQTAPDSRWSYEYVRGDGSTTVVTLAPIAEDVARSLHPNSEIPGDATGPFFLYERSLVIPKSELLVTFHAGTTDPAALLPTGVTVLRSFPALRPTLLCRHELGAAASFELARQVAAHAAVVTAQPNFRVKSALFTPPDDPFFSAQWHLQNTGQGLGTAGADIDVLTAWSYTSGYPAPTIAILDEGVDAAHPDLVVLPGYDATDQPAPGGIPGSPDPFDPHGTVCAGLAAALTNNMLGVAGVSPESAILPVRVGFGNHWSESAWVVDGITWAANQGAGIISGSWGGSPPATAEEDAIAYARTTGRGGLGCLVCFAVGNTNTSIAFPAAYPAVFAVGASSPCDERATATSCDGETWWGSNFGPQLDLVAPGPGVWTTDLSGPTGFSSGDYFSFTGTSASCPIVAGSAALLLSLFPSWTVNEVETALRTTAADQVGVVTEDVAGWDPYMGWGRLDTGAMVTAAVNGAPLGPTGLTCATTTQGVELAWTLAGAVTAIEVRRNGIVLATLPGAATTFMDSVPSGNANFYVVQGFSGTVPAAPTACSLPGLFLRGDTSADASLDIVDAIQILSYLFASGPLPCLDAGDVDDNGAVQINDPVMLLTYLFQSGPAPALPFPLFGTDPTSDTLNDCP
ncbi:MAG: S8 family serine peptidase [Planctomycetota bacterium]